MSRKLVLTLAILSFFVVPSLGSAQKPPLTLDEFFNSVEIRSIEISPDGSALVIATERADWKNNRWQDDLWLYRLDGANGSLVPLTQSGHDSDPEWSPDSRWIAFLSDREAPKPAGDEEPSEKSESVSQVYVISATGGEAFPVTFGAEDVHAFDWSSDSSRIYFATRIPWTKEQKESYKKIWKDVIQYRESERGDSIRSVEIARVLASSEDGGTTQKAAQPSAVATLPYRVDGLRTSPDGQRLAINTISISKRQDSMEPYNIYLVDLPAGTPRLLSHTNAVYERVRWAPDSSHLLFYVELGSAEGPYRDVQPRVYWIDTQSGAIERWASHFNGAINDYVVLPNGSLFAAGRLGTEVGPYVQSSTGADFSTQDSWPGTYEHLATARRSPRVLL